MNEIPNLPISIQLFTLRTEMEKDPVATLRRVSEIGFKFVEPAGLFGLPPQEFRRVVEDFGMKIGSSHTPWAGRDATSEAIDIAGELGINQVAVGYLADGFSDVDTIRRTAETVNALQVDYAKAGIGLFLHNHSWEYAMLDGRFVIDHFLDHCPDIEFELDLYWAAHFGDNDVPEVIRKYRDRTIMFHVKDGDFSRVKRGPLLPLGEGRMDLAACLREADPDRVKYFVFEMDRCATDLWAATEKSFRHLDALVNGGGQ